MSDTEKIIVVPEKTSGRLLSILGGFILGEAGTIGLAYYIHSKDQDSDGSADADNFADSGELDEDAKEADSDSGQDGTQPEKEKDVDPESSTGGIV